MEDLNKALDDQIKALKELHNSMREIRKYIGGTPTELDFKSTCETIDRLLEQRHLPPLGEATYRQWGVTGGESMDEIYKLLDEWKDHVMTRCEGEDDE